MTINRDELNKQMLKICNLDITKYDDNFIENSVTKRIKIKNYSKKEEYIRLLETSSEEGIQLYKSLLISYSDFFRNPLTFAVLEKIVLPELKSRKEKSPNKEIRIWSAACAAGQETYSLAMLMNENFNIENTPVNYRIFASDYCKKQIEIARKGQFRATEIKKLTIERTENFFDQKKEMYHIKEELKKMIDFSVFDLLNNKLTCPSNSIFGDFDLVFCANIMFYYKPEFQKSIIDKASHCLTEGGYFITSETEREILIKHKFIEIYPYSCIFVKK